MSDKEHIGIFGGTFDPIHSTHVDIARAAMEHANLDCVLFVPAAAPPHKNHGVIVATSEDRYAMVEAAIADEPRFAASRVEIDRGGISYTADTLETIQKQHPLAEIYLILGADSLVDLHHWHNPKGILAAARLLVVGRPGSESLPKALEGQYQLVPFEPMATSSTDIRRALAAGKEVGACLAPPVARYIREKGLYGCQR